MGEWHEHLTRPKPLLTNVVLHDGVAARETVLVPEAVEDALRSVPLLAVAGPIVSQDPIDDSRERTQLRPPRGGLPRRYPGGTENDSILRTVLRSSPNTREGLAGAHSLDTTRPPGPARTSPTRYIPRLPVRATLTEGYTRSHFGPPQPDQPAASVGDYCAAVLSRLNRRKCAHRTSRNGHHYRRTRTTSSPINSFYLVVNAFPEARGLHFRNFYARSISSFG